MLVQMWMNESQTQKFFSILVNGFLKFQESKVRARQYAYWVVAVCLLSDHMCLISCNLHTSCPAGENTTIAVGL